MIRELELLGFLALGLVGGFGHCLGMCAPFVLWVADRFGGPGGAGASPLRRLAPQLLYGLGRLTTYAALGAAAGLLGSVVELAGSLVGVQRAAALVAGALLVLYALVGLTDLVPVLRAAPGGGLFARIAARLRQRQPRHPFLAGLFLGLLPCGLVYGALIAAAGTGGAPRAALALALFGLGTLPAMLSLALVAEVLRRRRAALNALSLLFVLAMGVWFLVDGARGMF
jgi:hypothetical protein